MRFKIKKSIKFSMFVPLLLVVCEQIQNNKKALFLLKAIAI